MKITNRLFSLIAFLFLLPAAVQAIEFGVVANIHGGTGNSAAEDNEMDLKIDLWPRLFTLIGDNAELLITAGVSSSMENDFYPIPELLHTEFSMRFGPSGLRLGRFNYSDPLSFIAEGLFDGAQFFANTQSGTFRAGVWYTGLLYKNNIVIAMTDNERINNSKPVDYDDFFDTYFASRRLIASLGWEHPSLGEFMHLNTALLAQVDLTGEDEKYNSQYLIIKSRIPVNNFIIELGGSLETLQSSERDEDFNVAFAGEAGFMWMFPGKFNSRLSFNGKYASGRVEDFCDAFNPVTSKYYGFILKHKMSGLSVFTLNYSSRINQFFGASANALYFVRNDLGTFSGYPLTSPDNKGYFLGPEFSARLIWSPVSDLQLNLGGGAFLPNLGDAGPDEKIIWRVELTAILAL